jgi:cyclopropane fatty-acyl-phospholipid synthase-like methyltransferase
VEGQIIDNWNELYQGNNIPQWEDLEYNTQFCEYILQKCNSNMRILELGAGLGHNAIHLAKKGLNVIASDVSPNSVKRCKTLALEAEVNLQCEVIDIFNLTGDEGIFDMIYEKGCWHTFFSAASQRKFVLAVSALLSEQGMWISSSGSADNNDDQDDPHIKTYPRFTLQQIASLVEDCFEICNIRKGWYGKSDGLKFVTWECLFQKRKRVNKALELTGGT